MAGLEPKFDRENEKKDEDESGNSKLVSNSAPLLALVTDFGKKMEGYANRREGKIEMMTLIKDMSPSRTDSGKFYCRTYDL